MAEMTDLANQLADLKLRQNKVIDVEQRLMAKTGDETIRERLAKILESDRENLSRIDFAILKSKTAGNARDVTQKHVQAVAAMMDSAELTLYDKFFQLELLKHQQTMTGLVLHKVAQSLSESLQDAMEPLNTVNFENRAHQEVLKGVLYFVGTRELAGKEPDMGLWASVEQGVAALKGAVGSVAGAAR